MSNKRSEGNIKEVVAYDLDGVLMPLLKRSKPYIQYSGEERKSYERARLWQYENDVQLRVPKGEFYIISSRQEKYRVITELWLKRNCVKAKEVILMDNSLTFNHILEHKLKYLIEKGITKYYEDDAKLIKVFAKKLPELEVIQIERTSENVRVEEDITNLLPPSNQITF